MISHHTAAAAGHGGHGRRQVPRGRGPVQRRLVPPPPHPPRRRRGDRSSRLQRLWQTAAGKRLLALARARAPSRAARTRTLRASQGAAQFPPRRAPPLPRPPRRVVRGFLSRSEFACSGVCTGDCLSQEGLGSVFVLRLPARARNRAPHVCTRTRACTAVTTQSRIALAVVPTPTYSSTSPHAQIVSARRARIGGVSVAEINELEVRDALRVSRKKARKQARKARKQARKTLCAEQRFRRRRRRAARILTAKTRAKKEPIPDMADRLTGAHIPSPKPFPRQPSNGPA